MKELGLPLNFIFYQGDLTRGLIDEGMVMVKFDDRKRAALYSPERKLATVLEERSDYS